MTSADRGRAQRRFHGIPFRVRAVARAGGVIAYPTEGVYGLGCRADSASGVRRVIDIKARDAAKGLILIAASIDQLEPWIDLDADGLKRLGAARPVAEDGRARTYIVPASAACPNGITGGRDTVAVRLTRHPDASALCRAADSAMVSTSANYSGNPPITRPAILRRVFAPAVDVVLARATGSQKGVSQIIDFVSGAIIRA